MSASVLIAPWLDGPARPLTVVHRSRLAWQLADRRGRVAFCVMIPGAVRLPHAVRRPVHRPDASRHRRRSRSETDSWPGAATSPDAVRLRVARWWRPARPRSAATMPALADAVDAAAVRRLASALAATCSVAGRPDAVRRRVVCGALVALRAAGHPAAGRPRRDRSGRADLERRTTATSAALLRAGRARVVHRRARRLPRAPRRPGAPTAHAARALAARRALVGARACSTASRRARSTARALPRAAA